LHVLRHKKSRDGYIPALLAGETAAEAEDEVLELLALLVVHELVAIALLELRQRLCGGWVRGCARLLLVHSASPLSLWTGSRGAPTSAGPFSLPYTR
jgi:hypothetical protein